MLGLKSIPAGCPKEMGKYVLGEDLPTGAVYIALREGESSKAAGLIMGVSWDCMVTCFLGASGAIGFDMTSVLYRAPPEEVREVIDRVEAGSVQQDAGNAADDIETLMRFEKALYDAGWEPSAQITMDRL
jgi:hypothetical protein